MGALGCSSLAPGDIWLRGAELCLLTAPLLLPAGPFAATFTSPSEAEAAVGPSFFSFLPLLSRILSPSCFACASSLALPSGVRIRSLPSS